MTIDPAPQKALVHDRVLASGDDLIALSHRIHAHPELSFEEVSASTWCADALEAGGFEVARHVSDIETAFVATFGSGEFAMNYGPILPTAAPWRSGPKSPAAVRATRAAAHRALRARARSRRANARRPRRLSRARRR